MPVLRRAGRGATIRVLVLIEAFELEAVEQHAPSAPQQLERVAARAAAEIDGGSLARALGPEACGGIDERRMGRLIGDGVVVGGPAHSGSIPWPGLLRRRERDAVLQRHRER